VLILIANVETTPAYKWTAGLFTALPAHRDVIASSASRHSLLLLLLLLLTRSRL